MMVLSMVICNFSYFLSPSDLGLEGDLVGVVGLMSDDEGNKIHFVLEIGSISLMGMFLD